jgi:hypothetical protein
MPHLTATGCGHQRSRKKTLKALMGIGSDPRGIISAEGLKIQEERHGPCYKCFNMFWLKLSLSFGKFVSTLDIFCKVFVFVSSLLPNHRSGIAQMIKHAHWISLVCSFAISGLSHLFSIAHLFCSLSHLISSALPFLRYSSPPLLISSAPHLLCSSSPPLLISSAPHLFNPSSLQPLISSNAQCLMIYQ